MHRQPGGVARGDEQHRNHSSGIAPTGLAVERNERSECRKRLLNRIKAGDGVAVSSISDASGLDRASQREEAPYAVLMFAHCQDHRSPADPAI
jgi:hypothetical protein